MTWLIVEDDPEIRNLVAVMMQVWGEKPMVLNDGNAAWQWLDSVVDGSFKGELPELALMDIRMPGHTGDQIAARMRLTERIKNIPIVLMTAFTLSETEVQVMVDRAGIDRLIKKPLPDMDDFRATLYRVRDDKRKSTTTEKAAVPAAEPASAATASAAAKPAATVSTAAASPASAPIVTASPPSAPIATQSVTTPPITAPAATSIRAVVQPTPASVRPSQPAISNSNVKPTEPPQPAAPVSGPTKT